jgi:hypothetical protein
VLLSVEAPEEASYGEVMTFLVRVENRNRSALTGAELIFTYPDHAVDGEAYKEEERVELGTIDASGRVEREFRARLYGGEGFQEGARARLSFGQEGSSLDFEKEAFASVKMGEFPAELMLLVPSETLSGETITLSGMLRNKYEEPLEGFEVRFEYPQGFFISTSTVPLTRARSAWALEALTPEEELEFEISGIIEGNGGEGKVFKAAIGKEREGNFEKFKEAEARLSLAEFPLDLSVEAESVASLSDELRYTIRWQNNFDVPLEDLALVLRVSGLLADFNAIESPGSIDARTQTVTVRGADHSLLDVVRPGASGEISVTLPVRDSYLPTGITNPTVLLTATLESPTKPPGLTVDTVRTVRTHETRVRGMLSADARVERSAAAAGIVNAGPYPLRVNQESTLTVHWMLRALASSFGDVTMEAVLAPGVEWTGETRINGRFGSLTYDRSRRTVRWEIEELRANQGLLSTAPEAIFQVRVLPNASHAGRAMPIIGTVVMRARDLFADVDVESSLRELESPAAVLP